MVRISTYTLKLDSVDRRATLVKETTHEYNVSGVIDTPDKAAQLFEAVFDLSKCAQEYFVMATLNGARRVTSVMLVSVGTLSSSLVHPREVFIRALQMQASSIIICHNHPSGQLDISAQDREVSDRIRQVGDLVGIACDDHIICGGGSFVSAM